MPRQGETYTIADDWRTRVETRMEELKINRAELARRCAVSRSVITELLDGEQIASTLVPLVHDALQWDPPVGALISQDEEELIAVYRKLTPEQKARMRERADTYAELLDPKKPITK